MKISPFGSVQFINLLPKGDVAREEAKTSKDGENGRDQYTRQQADSENSEGENGERHSKPSQEAMDNAVQAFGADPQTQASGISAATEGNGPGLRVVVKDAGGGVIRQFTGEEFLKLREAVASDKKGRGKLLDQKL